MPLQATSGAASYDAFGGGVPAVPNYIEDVFSTYLYTGTGAAQTITNNIDLSTKGGLVWIKDRSNAESHSLWDTARGVSAGLQSNATSAQYSDAISLTAYNSNGFSLGTDANVGWVNRSPDKYVSWSIAKAPKFFDVVTYSGSNSNQTISHNLGSAPGCIIIKKLDSNTFNAGWAVYHRSLTNPNNYYLVLNSTAAESNYGGAFISSVSSTTFTVAGNAGEISLAGSTYVAYLFAHNAGGFGLTGTDNVISCGSFTIDGSGKFTANLGYEPQWIMIKLVNGTSNWSIFDNMRGMPVGSPTTRLLPNTSDAESSAFSFVDINATGFAAGTGSGNPYSEGANYIYIAIRRGPMKVPTSGTSVFDVDLAGNASAPTMTSAFPVDLGFIARRSGGDSWYWVDRLRGTPSLSSDTTAAEASFPTLGKFDYMNGYGSSTSLTNYTGWNFRRAPSFFDEVCYTGTGSATTFTHNLGVAPELMIVKSRSDALGWRVYSAPTGNTGYLVLNANDAFGTSSATWNSTSPTSSVFTVGTTGAVNSSGSTYVAYLFASVSGVSKVGSYTGTGSTLTISCGFTGGARFVMVKRTDNLGSWWVWDTARGMVSGTDPRLALNTTDAETNANWVYTTTGGFQVVSTNSEVNASGGTYIFLAIA